MRRIRKGKPGVWYTLIIPALWRQKQGRWRILDIARSCHKIHTHTKKMKEKKTTTKKKTKMKKEEEGRRRRRRKRRKEKKKGKTEEIDQEEVEEEEEEGDFGNTYRSENDHTDAAVCWEISGEITLQM
jgi:hypothetical protein